MYPAAKLPKTAPSGTRDPIQDPSVSSMGLPRGLSSVEFLLRFGNTGLLQPSMAPPAATHRLPWWKKKIIYQMQPTCHTDRIAARRMPHFFCHNLCYWDDLVRRRSRPVEIVSNARSYLGGDAFASIAKSLDDKQTSWQCEWLPTDSLIDFFSGDRTFRSIAMEAAVYRIVDRRIIGEPRDKRFTPFTELENNRNTISPFDR